MLILFVNVVVSAPRYDDVLVDVRYDNHNDGLGSYSFELTQSDGIYREERGELKNKGSDNEYIIVVGKYSWEAPGGTVYVVTYTADETGYHPTIKKIEFKPPETITVHLPALVATLLG